jgi:hypothetical protein
MNCLWFETSPANSNSISSSGEDTFYSFQVLVRYGGMIQINVEGKMVDERKEETIDRHGLGGDRWSIM